MKKIAIFGSAFNPPSLGHKSVIESLSHFDLVLLEPSIAHAWGKNMLDYQFGANWLMPLSRTWGFLMFNAQT